MPHSAEQTPTGYKILNNSTQLKTEKKLQVTSMQLEHLSRKLLVWGSVWKPCVGQLKIQNPARHWSDQRQCLQQERCAVWRNTWINKAGGTQPGALPGSKSPVVEWPRHTRRPCSLLPHHLSHGCPFCTAVLTVWDLFWSTELKELLGSQITYLEHFFLNHL